MKLPSKRNVAVFITIFLLYSSAYLAVRSAHWLVHRTGYYSVISEGKKLDDHFVYQGDFGTPMLAPIISIAQGGAAILFWPAVQFELVYWRLVAPHGSPWQTNNLTHHSSVTPNGAPNLSVSSKNNLGGFKC